MIKVIIIDDEQNNIDNLVALISTYCTEITITGTATGAIEGKKIIEEQQPDILFLDIQMPRLSGFELLASLPLISCEVIFVTAFDKYAVQAFKFSAVDYLLKPVDPDALKAAVRKAVENINNKKQNLHLKNLVALFQNQQKKEEHRIALSSLKETRFVFTRQVWYCESSNNYTTFFLDSGEKIVVSKPIYEFEEILSEYGFIRCHQSYLVNKLFIKSLAKDNGIYLLLLTNDKQVPVSRNKKEMVLRSLQ